MAPRPPDFSAVGVAGASVGAAAVVVTESRRLRKWACHPPGLAECESAPPSGEFPPDDGPAAGSGGAVVVRESRRRRKSDAPLVAAPAPSELAITPTSRAQEEVLATRLGVVVSRRFASFCVIVCWSPELCCVQVPQY